MDAGNGIVRYNVQPYALAVYDHIAYCKKGNAQLEMDSTELSIADIMRTCMLLFDSDGIALVCLKIIKALYPIETNRF